MIDAKEIIRRHDELKAKRDTWDTLWQDIANYVVPRKSAIQTQKTADIDSWTQGIHDTTAIEGNQTLAAGQMSYITPQSERWFRFEHPDSDDEESERWFQTCTRIALKELARSNFYLQAHEFYLDRGAFGTGLLYCEEASGGDGLRFANHAVGTYAISENEDGRVDTIYREMKMTARQIYGRFGESAPGKIKQAAEKGGSTAEEEYEIIHAVFPRLERDPKKIDPENKPYASYYVDVKHQEIIDDSGYDELPYFVSRFLKWQDCYGYSPSVLSLPTTRQINHIEQCLDSLGEIKAFPRVLIPDSMEGDVDLRAGGKTHFDAQNPNAIPREWGTQGDYNIGKDRALDKQQLIRSAYFVDMFKMLINSDKEMTATEVMERLEEKLILFSPTFMQLNFEFTDPMLERVFAILYRQGKFPEAPPTVFEYINDVAEGVLLPNVSYENKIAKAIRLLESKGILSYFEVIAPMAEINPAVLDNFDMDAAARALGESFSVPNEVLRPSNEVAEIRAQRQAQEQIESQVGLAQGAAKAARDFSQADITQIPLAAG